MSKEYKSLTYYYINRGQYGQLIQICDGYIAKKGKDPFSLYWKAYGLGMTGNVSECIRQMQETSKSRKEMQYPVSIALIYFYRMCSNVDREAIQVLTSELSIVEDVAKDTGLVMAARFSLHSGDFENASRLCKKVLSRGSSVPTTPTELEAYGINFLAGIARCGTFISDASELKSHLQGMDGIMKNQQEAAGDLDLLMLWARSRQMLGKQTEALNVLNKVIATFPGFLPGLSEKSLLLASAGEWDQATDTASRVLEGDAANIDALKVVAVHAFTQQFSSPEDSNYKFDALLAAIRAKEPQGVEVLFDVARLFSRICGRNNNVLEKCHELLDQALTLRPTDSKLFCELGRVCMMQGQYHTASRMFKDASRRDSHSVLPLEGMILCQLFDGMVDDAEAQTELFLAMHSSDEEGDYPSPEFAFVQALLAHRKRKDPNVHLQLLIECRKLYSSRGDREKADNRASLQPVQFFDFVVLSPDFLLQLAVAFAVHMESNLAAAFCGVRQSSITATNSQQENTSVAMDCNVEILQYILKVAPGISATYVELARTFLAQGKHEDAVRHLRQCLAMRPNYAAALVLMAKVEASRGETAAADRVLEQALSGDFSVRSIPLFRFVQAVVRFQHGKTDDAVADFEVIVQLIEFCGVGLIEGPGRMASDSLRVTDDDIVCLYVVYASALSKSGRTKEARKVLSNGKVLFAGMPQEVHILIASSQLAVERNDFDSAIRMLDKVDSDSPTFVRAQLIKAEILLVNSRNKEGYVKCFTQLVEKYPTSRSFALLGEAHLRILNPEAAVVAFEEAFMRDSANLGLRARIGKALVATHEYHRAIDFYESCLRDIDSQLPGAIGGELVALAHDLARLYIKLGRLESASRVLLRVLHHRGKKDIGDMRDDVETFHLLSSVQTNNDQLSEVIETLQKAKDMQREIVGIVRSNGISPAEVIDAERQKLSDICLNMGNWYFEQLGNDDSVENCVNEALQHNPQNTKAMFALAKLRFRRGETDLCAAQCNKILSANVTDEQAAVMLADILFKENKSDSRECLQPLQNLLSSYPNRYGALYKLIVYLRRLGALEEAPDYIDRAAKADNRSGSHIGLHFCKGLYARYTNDIVGAVKEFNMCRKDSVWGAEALVHMIELYLNPDQEGVWEEKEAKEDDATVANESEAFVENIQAAEALLEELRPLSTDARRVRVLQNYCLLSTKQKTNVDCAMQSFIELMEQDNNYLPAVLGTATGFMIEKSQHKARNLLKRVAKMELAQQDGEDFEKANLLLAKFYVDKEKYDLAQDLCKRCLAQNRSCSQAWEILGLAMEKESDYKNAVGCYEKAWKLEFEASAAVGFKLSSCYLKCDMFVEAIDICEKVLGQYPDYPRIRTEILLKAQSSLRT